jgi:hypothetical protein
MQTEPWPGAAAPRRRRRPRRSSPDGRKPEPFLKGASSGGSSIVVTSAVRATLPGSPGSPTTGLRCGAATELPSIVCSAAVPGADRGRGARGGNARTVPRRTLRAREPPSVLAWVMVRRSGFSFRNPLHHHRPRLGARAARPPGRGSQATAVRLLPGPNRGRACPLRGRRATRRSPWARRPAARRARYLGRSRSGRVGSDRVTSACASAPLPPQASPLSPFDSARRSAAGARQRAALVVRLVLKEELPRSPGRHALPA